MIDVERRCIQRVREQIMREPALEERQKEEGETGESVGGVAGGCVVLVMRGTGEDVEEKKRRKREQRMVEGELFGERRKRARYAEEL